MGRPGGGIYVREPCPAVWELGLYTQQTVTASLGGIGFLRQVLSCNFRKNYAGCVTVLKNRIWHHDSSHINLLVLKHKEMLINVFWKFYFFVQIAEANGMVRQIHSTVCALSFFPHFSLPVTWNGKYLQETQYLQLCHGTSRAMEGWPPRLSVILINFHSLKALLALHSLPCRVI